MTVSQAKQLDSELRKDPTVKELLDKIRTYQNAKAWQAIRKAMGRGPRGPLE